MKNRVLAMLTLAAVLLSTTPPARSAEYARVVSAKPARLLAALPNGKTLAEIPGGSRLEVLDRRVSGTNFATKAFLRVRWERIEGWIDGRDTAMDASPRRR